jgi:hypothetical protein
MLADTTLVQVAPEYPCSKPSIAAASGQSTQKTFVTGTS